MTAAAVLDVARRELGTAESPAGSNRQKYGVAYGWNGVAWCAQFAWWVLTNAGDAALIPKTASTVVMRDWFMGRSQWRTTNPQPGDLVFFKFPGNPNPVNHVGLVEALEKAGTLLTIEGNTTGTNVGDQRNGGMVARKRRLSNIVGFARPAYLEPAAPQTLPQSSARKDADVLDNIDIKGEGSIRLGLPVGRSSAVYARAWVSLLCNGPAGAGAKVYAQSDGGGLAARELSAIYRDGWSSRAWWEVPDGTSQINVVYNAPDGGVLVLEALPR